jgi:HMG (high mobility group) box
LIHFHDSFYPQTTDIAKLVSEAWREMGAEEKDSWEQKARKDKARYEVEKAMYKGPWKIPANKRTPKDPTAPKRPMSAFLAFSNKRRAGLKRENPDATNADLSKMLSKTWKEAPDELRKKYMEEEAALRATYKVEMAKWRKRVAEEKKSERDEREAVAMQAAEARTNDPGGALLPGMSGGDQIQQKQQQQFPGNAMSGGAPNQDMSNGQTGGMGQMYGNAYGMAGAGAGQFGNMMGMQGGGGDNAAQYANLMGAAAGNPFGAAQSFMGANAQQQMLLNQLLGQQFKNQMGQGGGANFNPGAGAAANMGMNMNPMAFGMGQGMDPMAAQRAMFEAQQQAAAAGMGQGGGGGGGFPGAAGFGSNMSGGGNNNNMYGGGMGSNEGKGDQDPSNFGMNNNNTGNV